MNINSISFDRFENEIKLSLWNIEIQRYHTINKSLIEWKFLFKNKIVMDYGAGYGLSMGALLFHGAKYVFGIEPDEERVKVGRRMLQSAGLSDQANLIHVTDTLSLPFQAEKFGFVIANAVLEHIPIPRTQYLLETWRVVAPGGYLMINETPNKYFPKESHTTNLWFNHWFPESTAYKRAIRRKRFSMERKDWKYSGWRGLGYLEIATVISRYQLVPENSRLRHRILSKIGLPSSIFDPYPTWVFRKIESKKDND